ncbi:hypothetical protein FJY71_01195 [candidate division WOR-3 bacterium]|nr:hypothetical protein [candidate division WOR-3 bacterium]
MDNRLTPLFSRRSVRRYSDRPLAPADVTALLEAGMAAPSASNRRPWHFVTITDPGRLAGLASIHPHGKMLARAGLGIAVCGDRDAEVRRFFDIPDGFGVLCLIAAGHPAEQPPARTQYDPARVHLERW